MQAHPISLEPTPDLVSPRHAIPELDKTVPALIFKLSRNAVQHSTVGIIRSLGSRGVPVYACVEDRLAPASVARHLRRAFVWQTSKLNNFAILAHLVAAGERLGRQAILIPTDDKAAVFIAEHAAVLSEWFLFPRLPGELPGRLSDKRALYRLCKSHDVPCPVSAFPGSLDDVNEFIEHAVFPVVVKVADLGRIRKGARSVRIARSAPELLSIYRQTETPENPNVIFQEYIPEACAEDWVFHGYTNPHTGCLVAFTGKKLRSFPVFAGATTLGLSAYNQRLVKLTEKLLKDICYAGVMDIDYRLDRRDGQYKLLDFNPRVGANFRMFEDAAGIDVVRALHLDLTGRSVPRLPPVEGRKFLVEPYDVAATAGYLRSGRLTLREWWRSIQGSLELAWFRWDDPLPFLTMCPRILIRSALRAARFGWLQLAAGWSRLGFGLGAESAP
jgi:D-aspartate ligase